MNGGGDTGPTISGPTVNGAAANGTARATAAAAVIRECRAALAARGSTILHEIAGGDGIDEWRHYPPGDAYDPRTHAQYFFHRHAAAGRSAPSAQNAQGAAAEAGHFHLFLRADGMPRGAAPLLLPEAAIAGPSPAPQAAPSKRGMRDEISHLVAVALGESGEPERLFTTNRWVTGETWYRAEDVVGMLDRFALSGDAPSLVLNRWLGALVRLFQPEIAMLLRQRDAAVMDPRRRRRRVEVFEDPRLEEVSTLPIDLDARLAAVERLAQERPAPRPLPAPRLPRMAEGWGR